MTSPDDTVGPEDTIRPEGAVVAEPGDDRHIPTVLFVDDEEHILDGLRVSLRKLRHQYRFLFVGSADEAIAVLETEPVDMVISDMRMPERNGADLLEEVRFRFPDVIRYVLSGQAGDRLVQRSVAVTHRWLNKPCDRDVLVGAIAGATGTRSELYDPAVRRAIGTVDALPSHPEVFRWLAEDLAGPGVSIDQVVVAAAVDPGLTAKLLQWAHSISQDDDCTVDVRTAVERIGIETLGRLSSANDVVRPLAPSEVLPGFDTDLFYRYARDVAAVAAALVEPVDAELARTAGLLSTVGILIEASHLGERLDAAYARALADGVGLVEVEEQFFGLSHVDLGANLLALWGLPRALVDIVARSHGAPDPSTEVPLTPVDAVRAAHLLVQRLPRSRALGAPHRFAAPAPVIEALDRWSTHVDALSGLAHDEQITGPVIPGDAR